MNYWLFKSEPTTFSIADLENSQQQITYWNGIRNYQVRNWLRSNMQVGDRVFFYHSNIASPGIVGAMKIIKSGYPDFTAQDKNSKYYDPKSTTEEPIWYMVDVQLIKKFKHMISLNEIKKTPSLKNMLILQKGNRLSITPVRKEEWEIILALKQ